MDGENKTIRLLFLASGLFFAIVTIIALLVPPMGIVDNSVIAVIGELGLFVSVWGAILDNRTIVHRRGDSELEIDRKKQSKLET